MPRRTGLFLLTALLGGCAGGPRAREAEEHGFERGYGQAVKDEYWILQNEEKSRQAIVQPQPPSP